MFCFVYLLVLICFSSLPSQVLALNRGEQNKVLTVKLTVPRNVEKQFLAHLHKTWAPRDALGKSECAVYRHYSTTIKYIMYADQKLQGVLAPVVQRPDNFIQQWISHYPTVSIYAKISVFPLVQTNMHTVSNHSYVWECTKTLDNV